MPNIPLAQQATVFQPQTTAAPTQGFQALQQLFGGVQQEAFKLSAEQIQADKLAGSNQIQNSIRQLQTDAATKFPGNYSQQQQFVNSGAQSFLKPFIAGGSFVNRGYFTAVSKNLLGAANFSFAKNIASQQLQNQRVAFDSNYNTSVENTNELIRNGNTPLAKDKMGQTFQSINNAVAANWITPQQGEVYHQKALVSNNLAGAKNKIDLALAQGGIPASLKMQAVILSDKNSPILNNPLLGQTYAAQVKSYVNGVNAGLRATQSANKSQINAIESNALKTGKFDIQKVTSFGIENKVAQAVENYSKTWEFFTESPAQREKSLSSLDLGTPNGIAISKNEAAFETVYNKDPMNFLMQQTSVNHGSALANATPEQLQNMRTAAVAIQRQRGDAQIKPMTNGEMAPVVLAAQQASATGDISKFVDSYDSYGQLSGKFRQAAQIQLGAALKNAGVDDSVETVSYFADQKSDVPRQVLMDSTVPLGTMISAAAIKLNETPAVLKQDVNAKVTTAMQTKWFSTPGREKFISSMMNGAGAKKGVVLAALHTQIARYVYGTMSRGVNKNVDDSITKYLTSIGDGSFNFAKQNNGMYIRIPFQFEGLPLDQGKVGQALDGVQSNIKMNDLDLSGVIVPRGESQATANSAWFNSIGSNSHWMTATDGESYVLMDAQNQALKSKRTGKNIVVTNNDIVNNRFKIPEPSLLKKVSGASAIVQDFLKTQAGDILRLGDFKSE